MKYRVLITLLMLCVLGVLAFTSDAGRGSGKPAAAPDPEPPPVRIY